MNMKQIHHREGFLLAVVIFGLVTLLFGSGNPDTSSVHTAHQVSLAKRVAQ